MPRLLIVMGSIAIFSNAPQCVTAQNEDQALQIGDTAPIFSATNQAGKKIKLADFRGQFVVLTFNRAHW